MTDNNLPAVTRNAPPVPAPRGPSDRQQLVAATPENSQHTTVAALPRDGATPAPVPAEQLNNYLAELRKNDPEGMKEYEAQFKVAEEAPYLAWFLNSFVPQHLREFIPDTAGSLHLGAALGRWHYHAPAQQPTNGATQPMDHDPYAAADPALVGAERASPESLDNRIRDVNARKHGQFDKGNRSEAQRLDEISQKLYKLRYPGDQSRLGGGFR